jgi:spore maturation protein CgeB
MVLDGVLGYREAMGRFSDGPNDDTIRCVLQQYQKAGVTFLFERGGIYRGQCPMINGAIYGSYGTGDKPLFMQSKKNYADPALWEETEWPNVWKLTENLINVNCHGFIDYHTDMYKVFNLSKINLNITLPSIETGIPQRIFDILGAGGFVMTNYQEELEDYFTPGVDLETYKDIPELIAKCRYYLTHEDARLNIAYNGFNTAHSKYSSTAIMRSLLTNPQIQESV